MSLWLSPKIRNQAENHRFTPSGKWRNLFPKTEQKRPCLQRWTESRPLSCHLAQYCSFRNCGREFGRAWHMLGLSPYKARVHSPSFSLGLNKTIFAVEYNSCSQIPFQIWWGEMLQKCNFAFGCNDTVKEGKDFLFVCFLEKLLLDLDKPSMTNELLNTLSINTMAYNYPVLDQFFVFLESQQFLENKSNCSNTTSLFFKISHSL